MLTLPTRRLLMSCAFGCAFVAGCQLMDTSSPTPQPCTQACTKTDKNCAACNACGTQNGNVVVKSAIQAPPAATGPAGFSAVPIIPVPPPVIAAQMPAKALPGQPSNEPPLAHEMPKAHAVPVLPAPPLMPDRAIAQVKAQPPVAREEYAVAVAPQEDRAKFPRGAQVEAPRKGFSDITAHPSFGHAQDYTWISGEAMCWRKEWRLRYATVEEVDPYGGSLRLVGEYEFGKLQDGEHYKISGRVLADDGRGPGFQIDSVEPAR